MEDVPSEKIILGELGQLGADGRRYAVLPDHATVDVTPNASGVDFYKLVVNEPSRHHIVLTCGFDPSIPDPFSNTWTIAGETVKTYQHIMLSTNTYSIRENLQSSDLATNPVSFYWINGGAGLEVACAVTVRNVGLSVAALFTVNRPLSTLTNITTTNVPPVNIGTAGDETLLEYGVNTGISGQDGIAMHFTVTTPTNGAGTFGILQIIDETTRRWKLDDLNGTPQKVHGTNLLDSVGQLVLSETAIAGNETKSNHFFDSPAQVLYYPTVFTSKWASADDEFTGYLVYKPTGDSIWVTLREVSWSWSGGATKGANGVWTLDSGYEEPPTNPLSFESFILPTWYGAPVLLPTLPDE